MIKVKICYKDNFIENTCNMILVNTTNGNIGIKENHVNLITQLTAGTIKLFNENSEPIDEIQINSGLLEFNNNDNSCIITVLN